MDPIKEAFLRIKEEINELRQEIIQLKLQLNNTSNNIPTQNHLYLSNQTDIPTQNPSIPTQNPSIPTQNPSIPTQNYSIQSPYSPNNNISIGNDGVQTNRQTDTQTLNQTHNSFIESDFKKVNNMLDSLDSIKKEIRLKFKRLTPQEMLVFSHLYTLEEQNFEEITYKAIASKIKLSESSIRDYINKLINKGIPIEKFRQNNKTIILQISKDLKNIATLATIQNLRQL